MKKYGILSVDFPTEYSNAEVVEAQEMQRTCKDMHKICTRYAGRPNQLAADIEVIDLFRHITSIFCHTDGPRYL